MKLFLKYIGIIVGVYILLVVGFRLYIYCSYPSGMVKDALVLNNSCSTLVIGPSNGECCWNDNIILGSKNLCMSGLLLLDSYSQLRYVNEYCDASSIDTVVLCLSFFQFVQYTDDRFIKNPKISELLYSEQFSCVNPWEFVKNHYKSFVFWEMVLKTHPTKSFMINKFPPLGGFLSLNRYRDINSKEVIDEMMGFQQQIGGYDGLTKTKIYKEASTQVEYLNKIIDYCQSNNWQLVLLSTPIKGYQKVISDKGYKSFLREVLPDNVLIADYSDFELRDESFADMLHVSYKGAEVFSKKVFNDGLNYQTVEEYTKE